MATIFDILLNQHLNANCKQSQCPKNKTKSINFLPPLDVAETNDSITIEVELAGVDKNDIDIEIKESILVIQGEKKKASSNSTTSTVSTTTSSLPSSNISNTESNDLPTIEEFEEGDPSIKKTVASTNISSTPVATEEPKSETKKKYIIERTSGHFKRYIDLTKILYTLDLNSISSNYTNGLLTVSIKKKPDYSNTIKINLV
ncbi:hypothetical protein DICPUDRAFT_33846 [Dictyostelium purpureum]|uniref:SHSP domain-containing protein n=1 Tax=Dictyostelium purpureum TaxID=5786 RepID=F0ZLK8_DICPU|nr:uncharacterized protein DICPUDRAFT_33846 [Dictyostelium purpureum]EGC35158.1 hypothetical protein DICPUDRAFT_33846 [Dictyostelium purpureum]|eukprot:XP_003288296.1 hypothetical protein DICPUDRAFT_33846 [Dictyostelium purpureum]